MHCILTQEELEKLCEEWKKILRLEHWDTRITIARDRDFAGDDNEGEIDYILEKGDASIRILDASDYPYPKTPFKQDMEATLVHELLHLHFAPFKPDKEENDLAFCFWERTIDDLSKILVKLKRERDNVEINDKDVEIEFVSDIKPKKKNESKKK